MNKSPTARVGYFYKYTTKVGKLTLDIEELLVFDYNDVITDAVLNILEYDLLVVCFETDADKRKWHRENINRTLFRNIRLYYSGAFMLIMKATRYRMNDRVRAKELFALFEKTYNKGVNNDMQN